jgi:hypothetical protein
MKRIFLPLLIAVTTLVWTSDLAAFGRDADGSRMQARPHKLGTSSTDHLSPPKDSVDWRYVRLPKSQDVTFSVKSRPPSASLRISITNAMGRNVFEGSTQRGSFTTRRRLDPGLYYVSVSSNTAASYTISIR